MDLIDITEKRSMKREEAAKRLHELADSLARHNALFLLDRLPLPELVVRVARLVSRQDAPGRPGERHGAE